MLLLGRCVFSTSGASINNGIGTASSGKFIFLGAKAIVRFGVVTMSGNVFLNLGVSGRLVTVTPFQQLETVNRQILLEGKK